MLLLGSFSRDAGEFGAVNAAGALPLIVVGFAVIVGVFPSREESRRDKRVK